MYSTCSMKWWCCYVVDCGIDEDIIPLKKKGRDDERNAGIYVAFSW